MILPKQTCSSAFIASHRYIRRPTATAQPQQFFRGGSTVAAAPATTFQQHTTNRAACYYHSSTQLSMSMAPATTALQNILPPSWITTTVTQHPLPTAASVAGLLGLWALLQYRGAIRKRIKMVREESWLFGAGVTMERLPTKQIQEAKRQGTAAADQKEGTAFRDLRLLELNPDFVRQQQQLSTSRDGGGSWSLLTLGDYMSSLRPKQMPKKMKTQDLPQVVQREIEAGLGAALLKALGPNLGRALLPALGVGPVQKQAQGLAARIATRWFLNPNPTEGTISQSADRAGVPLPLMTLLALSDLNAKINGNAPPPAASDKVPHLGLSALEKMKLGEVVSGESLVDLVPQNAVFGMETDFDRVIAQMEERLGSCNQHAMGHTLSTEHQMAQDAVRDDDDDRDNENTPLLRRHKKKKGDNENDDGDGDTLLCSQYDPEDRSMAAPVPVNPRLFPDLHLGWGDAQCSHTKREVLRMRLLALLLNRLGSNYARIVSDDENNSNNESLFTVRMNGKTLTRPADLIQALMDTGHTVEVVPSSRLTTFGVALCVKEPDSSWTNIPLGVFLESGYEDAAGNMAPAMMPHSGVDLYVTGPLVAGSRADGTPSTLRIQHFVGIEGFCGWKSHEAPLVPFNEAVESGKRLTGHEAVRAARISGLYATVLNGLATELDLPFGGYGLTAVCNDSAALVQQCLYNENTIYPMTSIGRYQQRTLRFAQRLRQQLASANSVNGDTTKNNSSSSSNLDLEVDELGNIVRAMKQLPSDINASPSNAASAARRMLRTIQPKLPFLLNIDSKRVMESILGEDDMEAEDPANTNTNNKMKKQEAVTAHAEALVNAGGSGP